jgi:hypothetical protein
VQPTSSQKAIVSALGATARWNRFGTPSSLIRYDGYLATGLQGDAVNAARGWIRSNKALFRLSNQGVDNLELLNDSRFAGLSGHAVIFRQTFGGVPAGHDGLITVGIANGKVAYVSSSAAGDGNAPGTPSLSPQAAWLAAASNVGFAVGAGKISGVRTENGWTVFDVAGFSLPQRARLVAIPTPANGVRPAFEANVVNVGGGEAKAYTLFVDARSGAVLMRHSRTEQLAQPAAALVPQAQTFSGDYTPTTCGPRHPFDAPVGTQSINVFASAALPANDIVLVLYYNGTQVERVDTGTSPELVINFTPPPNQAGVVEVEVCPFLGSITIEPLAYAGAITISDAAASVPFPPKWKLFTANPKLDLSSVDTRIVACWVLTAVGIPCDPSLILQNPFARAPWDYDLRTNAPTFTTKGNAALSGEAWASPLTPAEQYRPVSTTREYAFPWENKWLVTRCSPTVFTPQGNDIDAATANLFAMHNRVHDWAYALGFTEENFNLQDNNFGNTAPGPFPLGRENDPEVGNSQAGALTGGNPSFLGRDNANQITLQDGIPGITNMYLWQPIAAAFYPPCVDGDYDMSVIGHEYTHAISNRMVGGPNSGITEDQGGAMGESWSDLNAVEYLNAYGFVPTNGENPFAVGPYVTGNLQTGIRNYAMNASPLNFSDVGYDFVCNATLVGPPVEDPCVSLAQVHSDGELWSAVNFDIRQALIAKYNASFSASNKALQRDCADGKLAASQCPGNRRWIQIVYDAFLLMQADVSMLDARDAYLAADLMRFSGANQKELWRAFAVRGFGQFASTVDANDVDPVPSFETPVEANEATITFKASALNEGLAAVKAKIYVGDYEARVTPVADTDPATALSDRVKFAPGTYLFVAQAEGYGLFRFTSTFKASQTKTLTVKLPTNWASRSKGATISGDGVNLDKLIDDTEVTNWARLSATPSVEGSQVTVDLAGGANTVGRIQVSAMLRQRDLDDPNDSGSQNRFSALRAFEIFACNANLVGSLSCTAFPTGYTKIFTSPADAFPAVAPRPLAPNLIARSFNVPQTTATHVRLRVLTNQCTGGPAFQGEQDSDPVNVTDCVAGSAQDQNVRAAELQVFSQ